MIEAFEDSCRHIIQIYLIERVEEREAGESSIRTTSLERTNREMTGGINHSQVVFITDRF
ncbi:MAG TPA: hypothetical protein VIW25_06215 [Nitrososphaeraceae archaeon]